VFVCSREYLTFFLSFSWGEEGVTFFLVFSRCIYVRCTFLLLACSFLSFYVFARCTNHGENREGAVASSPLNMRGLFGFKLCLLKSNKRCPKLELHAHNTVIASADA